MLRAMLAEQVRPKYLVQIDEHLYVHELPEGDRALLGRGDVIIADPHAGDAGSAPSAVIAAPAYGRLPAVTDVEQSPVHYVELDLLRGGPRLPVDGLPPCDYYALVSLAEERPRVGIWPVRLRDPLPVIPVPLRAPDPPVHLDLRQAIDRVYDAAGYEDYIYDGRPQLPLSAADDEWAEALLVGAD